MKKNTVCFISTISFTILIKSLLSAGLFAQSPGFFLDDWKEKTAEIPAYEDIDKPTDPASIVITVDMNDVVNKVPEYVYGNNAVSWDNNMRFNTTAMKDLNNLNPHVLRFPGGSLSNSYFWNASYGVRPEDIPADLSPWYGTNTQSWQMGVDDFYNLLEETNSTGSICVNYSYARYGTSEDPVAKAAKMAANWVRYDNGRSKFWEIGNENFGNWEQGNKIDLSNNQDGQPEYISGELYGQHCKVFIDSMRAAAAEIGADIKIGVVAYDAETSWDPISDVWNEEMMPVVGDYADFLIVHSYFTPYNENSSYSTILNSSNVPAKVMAQIESDMAEAGKPMIPVVMNEWNIFAIGSMQQVSYINGMHASLVLGEFIKNSFGLAARWDLVNGWNNGDDHAMFSTGGEPGVDPYNPRPAFFYLYYFQKYFGDRMVNSSVSGSSYVIAHASSFSSGEAGMVIVNKTIGVKTARIEINNFEPGYRYYYHVLTGGTHDGSFSRKVLVNGIETDEEGGGPDEYESIKAYASLVEGGILVDLPPLSVVNLMVEKKPPLSLYYANIDGDASVINLKFSEEIVFSEMPAGFQVIANGSTSLTISEIIIDDSDTRILHLVLDQKVNAEDVLTLSYSGTELRSLDDTILGPLENFKIDNLLTEAHAAIAGFSDSFKVYPNPAVDQIIVYGNNEYISSIEIYNITGQRLIHNEYKNPVKSVKVSLALTEGIYLLNIQSAKNNESLKLIVR